MRTMIRVTIPVEAGNASLKNGRLPQVMREVLDRLKPEAAYFTLASGARTAYLVVDLKSQSDIPSMVEPFFMELNAAVDMTPVMDADDLRKGLSALQTTLGA